MYILLAEDDRRLGKLIAHMLTKQLHTVEWVQNGEAAFDKASSTAFDVLILDWMMPLLDGISVCKKLRGNGYHGAILLLTAKDALNDRVAGLDAGADDYLVKPFEFEELFARLRALSRRSTVPLQGDVIQVGALSLNSADHSAMLDGKAIHLTPREYQLLELFVRNKNQVLTREVILDRIWGFEAEVNSNTLDAYIKLLRKKIEQPGTSAQIRNVRGIGYKLESSNVS